jgi:peptidoglycan DL-endopeptidase RipA
MSTLTKTLVAVVATMLVGGAAYVAAAPTNPAAKQAAADVKGPCDEAEHAADPRCASPQVPEDNPNPVEHRDRNKVEDHHAARDDDQAEDVGDDNPGEVEHHGNRGPGSPNSGPGNAEGRGDDGAMEDNSGPSGDDSSHSGSGNSGSDDSGSDDSGSGGSGRD